jgi:transcriptional regulator with XRE-family HTH domain
LRGWHTVAKRDYGARMKKDLLMEIEATRVGSRLALVRKISNKTQEEFAARAGLKRNTYNQYETGKKDLSVEAATRLCLAYDLTLDYVFHNETSGLRGKMIDAIDALRRAASDDRS